MTIPELFDLSLTLRRDQPALDWQDQTLTFGQVAQRAHRMVSALRRRGLGPGGRLCVYLPNGLAFIELFLAATRLGAIFVPVNILYRDREISHILQDAEPLAIVATEESRQHLPDGATVWLAEELTVEAGSAPEDDSLFVHDPETPAAIVYTSGTTGASKGAVLSHRAFTVNAVNLLTCWQITSADRLLLALPLFHVHGLGNGLHCWLASGCRLMLTERFDHRQAAAWMLNFKPTLFFGVPTMYVRMLEWPVETASRIGSAMRLFVSGSAPLPAQTLEEFRERFGHTILERYGMSETLMNLSNPYVGERRPGSVGRPLPGVRARVLRPDFQAAADGESGELFLQGPNLFSGYWRRPEATAAAFHDGWFRTGDLAVRSPDGYFTLQGRRSDLIISGGFNIYPREIEEFLVELDGVAEAAVAAMPDAVRGEVPVAYLVAEPGAVLDTGAVEAACRAHLASFKIPRAFLTMDHLPRTALGKVQKHLLPRWPSES